jgi:hypothetical protein
MELTKEHFDQALQGLATQESVDELAGRMTKVEKILNGHTTALDAIAQNTKTWDMELPVLRERLQRMEDWITRAATKLGVDYKP